MKEEIISLYSGHVKVEEVIISFIYNNVSVRLSVTHNGKQWKNVLMNSYTFNQIMKGKCHNGVILPYKGSEEGIDYEFSMRKF